MNMEEQTLPLVPFGKYKGQPITTLLNDTSYLEWCKQQEFFQKYPIVYNICVNQTITTNNQNAKTPEHNKLQNLFLDEQNQIKLLNILLGSNIGAKFKKYFELLISDEDFINSFGKIDMPDIYRKLEYSKIVFEDKYNWDFILYHTDHQDIKFETKNDIKTSSSYVEWGDDPKCKGDRKLRYLYNILGKYEFKYNHCGNVRVLETDIKKNEEDKNNYEVRIFAHCTHCIVCCELKPTLSDDYPCVLRKMRTQIELTKNDKNLKNDSHYYVLLIGSFISNHTTKEELILIFKQSDIKIIFTNEIVEPLKSLLIVDINTTKLLPATEEAEIQSLKAQKQSKSIKDYFGKK